MERELAENTPKPHPGWFQKGRKKTGGKPKGYIHDWSTTQARLHASEGTKQRIEYVKQQGLNDIKSMLLGATTSVWHPKIPSQTVLTEEILAQLSPMEWLTVPVKPAISMPIRYRLEALYKEIDDLQRRMYAGKSYFPVPKETLF